MASVPPVDQTLLDDLVDANRILYTKNIVDGLGHVSARHDKDPNLYVMAAEKAPGLVSREDLAIYDLDSNAQTLKDRRPYNERFIHGEIYKARPDIKSVIHCHTPSLVTFCVCQVPLRPLYHMSGFSPGDRGGDHRSVLLGALSEPSISSNSAETFP